MSDFNLLRHIVAASRSAWAGAWVVACEVCACLQFAFDELRATYEEARQTMVQARRVAREVNWPEW